LKRAYTSLTSPTLLKTNLIDEIKQGQLGDCYFLAGLSAISEWSTRIKSSILTQTITPAGVFAAKVFIKGVPTTVVVDDYLLFYKTYAMLNFEQQAPDGTIWAALMEKVFAKASSSYENIIGGYLQEAMTFVLGLPTSYTSMGSLGYVASNSTTIQIAADAAWAAIWAADKANYVIETAVGSSNTFGLVNGHAYSLLGAYVVNDTGVISKLYKIRNPWSRDVYNGKWNDSDTASWTPAAINQTDFVKNLGDGVFWIDYRDFVQAFSSYSIGYINDKYVHSTIEAVDTLTTQSFNFTVPTSQ
jgi:Calpain family cysteine protease